MNKDTSENLTIHFKVQGNTSALGLLAANPEVVNGDVYAEDGFIYRDGIKIRKYWQWRDGWNHFWGPTVYQLSRVEAIYNKLWLRRAKHYEKLCKLIEETYGKAPFGKDVLPSNKLWTPKFKLAFAKLHSEGGKLSILCYEIGEHFRGEIGAAIRWIDFEKDEVPDQQTIDSLLSLGQPIHNLEFTQMPKWWSRIKSLFIEAIAVHLKANHRNLELNQTFHIKINGRDYWGKLELVMDMFVEVKIFSWPEDTIPTIIVK